MKLPPVWIYKIVVAIRNRLRKMYYAFVPANVAVFEMAQHFWVSKSLGVVCELDIAEIIGSGTKHIDEIAKESSVDPASLYRLLRALASEGVFKEVQDHVFSNTKKSASLIPGEGSMKYMIQHQLNTDNWAVVNELKYSVTTGKSAVQKLFGEGIFEHIGKDPEKNALYNKAMINTSDLTGQAILGAYNFSGIRHLVDVGGGKGKLIASIIAKYPQMEATLLDLPHVVADAEKLFEEFGVAKRVKVEAGSFFDIMPNGGDAYIMKNILHNFDDESSVELMKRIRKHIHTDGRLLIAEMVIPEGNTPFYGKMFDLQMLLGTDGSKERTRKEFADIFSQAGFKLTRVVDLVSPFSIIEGHPV